MGFISAATAAFSLFSSAFWNWLSRIRVSSGSPFSRLVLRFLLLSAIIFRYSSILLVASSCTFESLALIIATLKSLSPTSIALFISDISASLVMKYPPGER